MVTSMVQEGPAASTLPGGFASALNFGVFACRSLVEIFTSKLHAADEISVRLDPLQVDQCLFSGWSICFSSGQSSRGAF
jgi:hypothetical protein